MLNYQANPHLYNRVPPSQLLFNRKIKTKLLQVETDVTSHNTDFDTKQKDEHANEKMKENEGMKAQTQVSDLKICKILLLSQKKKSKIHFKT